MKQVPDYIVKKTKEALTDARSDCEYWDWSNHKEDDPNFACRLRAPDGDPGCWVCELVAYWNDES